MRRSVIALVGLAVLLSAPLARAEKAAKPAKRALVSRSPVFSPRADAALILRASVVKDLPRALGPADKRAVAGVAASLRAGRHAAARSSFERWAKHAPKRISGDDIILAALWASREGALGSLANLVDAASRVRFFDDRAEALATSIAELRVAASRSGVTLVHVPVSDHYVNAPSPGHEIAERRTEPVTRDDLAARLADAEAAHARAIAERDRVRDELTKLEQENRPAMVAVLSLVRSASDVAAARAPAATKTPAA
jgi:hypothetical protein